MKRFMVTLALFGLLCVPAHAQSVAEFYKGKTIRMIVGSSPGDYDSWARLIVRHLPRYVPGNPNFVVENMPGAGSLIASNHLYNRAAQDGTVIGSVVAQHPALRLRQEAERAVRSDEVPLARQPGADQSRLLRAHRHRHQQAGGSVRARVARRHRRRRHLAVGNAGAAQEPARHEIPHRRRLQGLERRRAGDAAERGRRSLPDRDRVLRSRRSRCSTPAPSTSCSPPSASGCRA